MIAEIRATTFVHGVFAKDEYGDTYFHELGGHGDPRGEYTITFDDGRVRKYQEGEFELRYEHSPNVTRALILGEEYPLAEGCRYLTERREVGL